VTHKYERVCWYCGSRDLENKGEYLQCRSCGATWNQVPALGASPVTMVDAETDGPPGQHRPTRSRPSGHVQRKAARAREDAG